MEKERQGKKKARTEGIFGCTPSQGGYKLLKETKASQHKNTEKRCVCEKCKKFNSVTRFFFYNFIYHTKSIFKYNKILRVSYVERIIQFFTHTHTTKKLFTRAPLKYNIRHMLHYLRILQR